MQRWTCGKERGRPARELAAEYAQMIDEGNTNGQHISVQRFVNHDTLRVDGDSATVTVDVSVLAAE